MYALITSVILAFLFGQERPGRLDSRTVVLPNRWQLTPAGKTIGLRDFPLNMVISPDGQYAAVVHSGYGRQLVAVVDLRLGQTVSEVTIDKTFYGLCFSPDGKTLYVSGAADNVVYAFAFKAGFLSDPQRIGLGDATIKIY